MSDRRQEMNVRVIRASFAAAMASEPGLASMHIRAANQYLADARAETTDPSILDAIAQLQAEVDGFAAVDADRRTDDDSG